MEKDENDIKVRANQILNKIPNYSGVEQASFGGSMVILTSLNPFAEFIEFWKLLKIVLVVQKIICL